MPDLALTPLDDLTVLAVRGSDAVPFLNGQLSQDITQLQERRSLLAGFHDARGRVLALPRLFHVADDHVLVALPASIATSTCTLLSRYILRSRVRIEEAGAAWKAYGIAGPDAEAAASTRISSPLDAGGWRQMVIAPRQEPVPEGDLDSRDSWRLEDIAAGIPEITSATSGQFVAQMLNLDQLDAVSFSKGCYTGQEVIARAHYRGQVKRRMQRFFTDDERELAPGSRIQLQDGRSALIVMAAPGQSGGQQFLAVAPRTPGEPGEPGDAGEPPGASARIAAAALPLPYIIWN